MIDSFEDLVERTLRTDCATLRQAETNSGTCADWLARIRLVITRGTQPWMAPAMSRRESDETAHLSLKCWLRKRDLSVGTQRRHREASGRTLAYRGRTRCHRTNSLATVSAGKQTELSRSPALPGSLDQAPQRQS